MPLSMPILEDQKFHIGADFSSKMTASKTVFYQNATQIRMIVLVPANLVAVVKKLSGNNVQNRKQISSNLMI